MDFHQLVSRTEKITRHSSHATEIYNFLFCHLIWNYKFMHGTKRFKSYATITCINLVQSISVTQGPELFVNQMP